MKRDMDLCRLLLLERESETELADLKDYPVTEVLYNLVLLKDAGLVDGTVIEDSDGNPRTFLFQRLTWAGHEFLDAARNDTLWHNAKGTFVKKGLTATFDTLKAVLMIEIKQHLGLP